MSDAGQLSIVLLADSSVDLATAWASICGQYLMLLLRNLQSPWRPTEDLSLGVCVYSPSNTYPRPTSTRFFAPLVAVLTELRDRYSQVGIGSAGSPGCGGMATLDGFVAAIEMIDQWAAQPHSRPQTYHIISFAALEPDDAVEPQWNRSTNLDRTTWDTLPHELNKRNIHLSCVSLKPIPRLAELHASSMAATAIQPWFGITPGHSVFLSGFTKPAAGTNKRPGETLTLQAENKRTKLQPTSPAMAPAVTPTPSQTKPLLTNTASTHVAAPVQPFQPPKLVPNPQYQERIRKMRDHIGQLASKAQLAHDAGDFAARDAALAEKAKVMDLATKVMHALQQGGAVPPNTPVPGRPPQTSPAIAALSMSAPPHNPQALAQIAANRALAGSGTPQTAVHSQMAKLMEQNRLRQHLQPTPASAATQPEVKPGPPLPWKCMFSYGGTRSASGQPKEVEVEMMISFQNTQTRPEELPTSAKLRPCASSPLPDLQVWVKQHSPVLCNAAPTASPQGQNENNFKQLITMLASKSLFALASWPLRLGEPDSPNMVFFTVRDTSLAAAVFPTTGIPELPKPAPNMLHNPNANPIPHPNPPMLNANTEAFRDRLAKMSEQERTMVLQQMHVQRMAHAGGVPPAVRPPTFGAGPQFNPMAPPLPGGVSPEMMRMFMQRQQGQQGG